MDGAVEGTDKERMAKIRAYKLAEELGLEKSDLVEKAAALGVVLKSAMATVGDEDVDLLRKKLVTESRVEAKGGAVIRRRKRAEPEPEPEPAPVPEPVEVAPPVVEPEPAVDGVGAAPQPEPAV